MNLLEIGTQLLFEGTEFVCDSLVYRFGFRILRASGVQAPDQFKAMCWALGIAGWVAIVVGTVMLLVWVSAN